MKWHLKDITMLHHQAITVVVRLFSEALVNTPALWLTVFLPLMAVRALAASTVSGEIAALATLCTEGEPKGTAPAKIESACTSAIDAKVYQARQLALLHLGRANVYDFMGEKSKALADYNIAVEIAPDVAGIYFNRGVYFASQNDFDAALKDYDAALRLDPDLVPALYNRARIRTARGAFPEAVADYSHAIERQPAEPRLRMERGLLYMREGDYRRGLEDEDEALRLAPKLALAHLYRGAALGRLGNSDAAVEETRIAISLDPALAKQIRTNQDSQDAKPAP